MPENKKNTYISFFGKCAIFCLEKKKKKWFDVIFYTNNCKFGKSKNSFRFINELLRDRKCDEVWIQFGEEKDERDPLDNGKEVLMGLKQMEICFIRNYKEVSRRRDIMVVFIVPNYRQLPLPSTMIFFFISSVYRIPHILRVQSALLLMD